MNDALIIKLALQLPVDNDEEQFGPLWHVKVGHITRIEKCLLDELGPAGKLNEVLRDTFRYRIAEAVSGLEGEMNESRRCTGEPGMKWLLAMPSGLKVET